ncbi:MAG: hypothetical protein IJX39_01340 [Clostridia bacterium]|nr:hypothetical protein [Clostridia bacterium]
MISKNIVQKIIFDNEDALQEQKDTQSHDLLIGLVWSPKRLALRDYIASLPFEEIIDLCSLMDYGRALHALKMSKCNTQAFEETRKAFVLSHHDPSEKTHLATYLLEKQHKLTQYLQCVLSLLE